DDIQPNDLVFSRDEFDPFRLVEAKLVQEKFQRTGRILHLHLSDGKMIRTTPEHPFYRENTGWAAAGTLETGERLRTEAGWVTVEEVYDTGTYETVYNVRVADYHTFFVGEAGWDCAVWAHNQICGHRETAAAHNASYARSNVDMPAITNPANQILRAERQRRTMPRAGSSA